MILKKRKFLDLALILLLTIILFVLLIKNSRNVYFSSIISFNLNSKPKIFCYILTTYKDLNKKARVVYDTWAHKCDEHRFIVLTPLTRKNGDVNESVDIRIDNSLHILHPAGLVFDSYEALTDKIYLTIKDVYKRHKGYDWYLKADDDSFIFVDNLRDFLKDKDPNSPVSYGYDFKKYVDKGYHSGGASYVLSREAFYRIGSNLNGNSKYCKSTGDEDIDVARCLRRLGVYPNSSIDDMGRERFHCLSVDDFYYGYFPKWLFSYSVNPVQKGLNCCSDTSISFHYMSPKDQIKLARIVDQQKREHTDMSFKYIIKKYFDLTDDQISR